MVVFEEKISMKKIINSCKLQFIFFVALIMTVTSFCSACGKKKTENYVGYYVFSIDTTETKVAYEKYTPTSKTVTKLIDEFLKKLQTDPDDISMKRAIPDDVVVDNYVLNDLGELSLYMNSSYGNYTGASEILRRAAIVKTLCQIDGVNGVQFYVAGQPIADSDMHAIGIMTADTFIDNTDGEKSYKQKAMVTVYFADSTGTFLQEVPIEITYDAAIPLEQLVVEQLMKGPGAIEGIEKDSMFATIPEGTHLNKITVKEKTCYIDFSQEFLNKRKNITADVAIYSVVNTLVELSTINKVQFSIDGEQVLTYNDSVNFGESFERNLDIVKDSMEQ